MLIKLYIIVNTIALSFLGRDGLVGAALMTAPNGISNTTDPSDPLPVLPLPMSLL